MDMRTDLFLGCESNRLWPVVLDMWLLLWKLLCDEYHGLVILQAVREQLVYVYQSLGRLAQCCAPKLLLPEGVDFLL